MKHAFPVLRGQLLANDLKQSDVASKLLISLRQVNSKMCGHTPWDLDEMYILMDWLTWPYDRMHELFPRNGSRNAA